MVAFFRRRRTFRGAAARPEHVFGGFADTYKADAGTVIHRIVAASNATLNGKDQIFISSIDGTKLTLQSAEKFGMHGYMVLTLERL